MRTRADAEANRECRPREDAWTVRVHGSAVRFRQLTDDSKSKTKAAVHTRDAAVRLSKAVKDRGEEQRRDPFTRVAHGDDVLERGLAECMSLMKTSFSPTQLPLPSIVNTLFADDVRPSLARR